MRLTTRFSLGAGLLTLALACGGRTAGPPHTYPDTLARDSLPVDTIPQRDTTPATSPALSGQRSVPRGP
jgi:hypothetical protein